MSWERIGSATGLMSVGVAALAIAGGQHDMDPHNLALWFLTVFGITMCCAGICVLAWPLVAKTIRNAHLIWPRERLYARYPSVRRIEHESGCRAWARDLEVVELDDPEGRHIVRGCCERCGATRDQRYIPRHHPDYGVRCQGDE